jgi:hypothetical protein
MNPSDVDVYASSVFKNLATGWAAILNTNMYVSHVALNICSLLDRCAANHADVACGTFLHLSQQ